MQFRKMLYDSVAPQNNVFHFYNLLVMVSLSMIDNLFTDGIEKTVWRWSVNGKSGHGSIFKLLSKNFSFSELASSAKVASSEKFFGNNLKSCE